MNNENIEKYVRTNIGNVPYEDYLEMEASKYGYDSYEDMKKDGLGIDISEKDIIVMDTSLKKLQELKKILNENKHNIEKLTNNQNDDLEKILDNISKELIPIFDVLKPIFDTCKNDIYISIESYEFEASYTKDKKIDLYIQNLHSQNRNLRLHVLHSNYTIDDNRVSTYFNSHTVTKEILDFLNVWKDLYKQLTEKVIIQASEILDKQNEELKQLQSNSEDLKRNAKDLLKVNNDYEKSKEIKSNAINYSYTLSDDYKAYKSGNLGFDEWSKKSGCLVMYVTKRNNKFFKQYLIKIDDICKFYKNPFINITKLSPELIFNDMKAQHYFDSSSDQENKKEMNEEMEEFEYE